MLLGCSRPLHKVSQDLKGFQRETKKLCGRYPDCRGFHRVSGLLLSYIFARAFLVEGVFNAVVGYLEDRLVF